MLGSAEPGPATGQVRRLAVATGGGSGHRRRLVLIGSNGCLQREDPCPEREFANCPASPSPATPRSSQAPSAASRPGRSISDHRIFMAVACLGKPGQVGRETSTTRGPTSYSGFRIQHFGKCVYCNVRTLNTFKLRPQVAYAHYDHSPRQGLSMQHSRKICSVRFAHPCLHSAGLPPAALPPTGPSFAALMVAGYRMPTVCRPGGVKTRILYGKPHCRAMVPQARSCWGSASI